MDARLIEKSDAHYSCGSERIGQGNENARQNLKDNSKMAEEIEAKLLGLCVPTVIKAEPDAELEDA